MNIGLFTGQSGRSRNPGAFRQPPMDFRRFPIVLVDSSAARMPFPGATISRAVWASLALSMLIEGRSAPSF